ncbi:MAG: glycosyltransferase, partial [Gammaproteobacteria bacterium]|nr:glycosyltransferase [Gammaproteobacteria bacterium]
TKPESFGRAVLEALSLGVPVIGYDHGGVGEILNAIFPEGKTPLNNASALHDRIMPLLKNKVISNTNDLFSKHAMLSKTLELYKKITTLP